MLIKNIDLQVGDMVKVNVLKYKGFRGYIVSIENNVALIKVPTYYGNQEPIYVHEEIKYLKAIRG